MDIKSKKFDKSMISKTIAFFLAIILFALTVNSVLTFFNETANDEAQLEMVVGALLSEDNSQPTADIDRLWPTLESINRFVAAYGMTADQKSYQAVTAREAQSQKAWRKAKIKNILTACKGNGNGDPLTIGQYYVDTPVIQLRHLGNHKTHLLSRLLEYDAYGFRYDSKGIPEEDLTEPPATDTVFETTAYQAEVIPQSTAKIPDRIKSQLKAGEIAVELCNCMFDGDFFDGYYALSVDTEAFLLEFGEGEGVFYGSYETYLQARDAALQELQTSGIWTFLLLDQSGHVVASNLDGAQNLTKKEIAANLLQNEEDYGFQITLPDGKAAALGDADSAKSKSSLQQLQRFGLDWSGANGTLYLSFSSDNYENILSAFKDNLIQWSIQLLLCLVCVIYLIIRSGRKSGDDDLHLLPTDHCFTLLRTAINLAVLGFGGYCWIYLEFEYILFEHLTGPLITLGRLAVSAALMAVLIDWLLFVARHIKNHDLLRNIFLVWLIEKCVTLHRRHAAQPIVYRDLWKDVLRRVLLLAVLPNIVIGTIAIMFAGGDVWWITFLLLVLMFLYDCFLVWYICRYAYALRAVLRAIHEIRSGNYDVQLSTAKMPTVVQGYANDVMQVRDGLQAAVQNAIKDERLRAELITNVSHDLKTPLTSIINYVDLLRRCDISDETANSYIAVLGEKSDRLKKLIEDLVEASKASSGAVKVEWTQLNLNELALQIAGEYEDVFCTRELDLVFSAQQEPILVTADGKLTYRILDNLMSNVKKYAMPGTRVYLDLSVEHGCGVLTLRNVSEQPLHVSVEALRERFVRGDSARSTEGSGLGLSIAENLCTLQGAYLALDISGDLFTAKITFSANNA